ncbi:MAG: hypothetical protein GEV03_25730 [Streptosporangiales bacterium]|nr:hypothetical protein [Streptosporangiales bacterium]
MSDLKILLTQELMDEVTEVGPIGVYELVWSLRGREGTLTDAERVALAKQVARDVLESGRAKPCRFWWPPREPVSGFLTIEDVTDDEWLDIR